MKSVDIRLGVRERGLKSPLRAYYAKWPVVDDCSRTSDPLHYPACALRCRGTCSVLRHPKAQDERALISTLFFVCHPNDLLKTDPGTALKSLAQCRTKDCRFIPWTIQATRWSDRFVTTNKP